MQSMFEAFDVIDGYDRSKFPRRLMVRRMAFAELASLQYGDHVKFIANDGKLRDIKINGRPKTWKTRPGEISIPVKYGMYETARFETREALDRLVVVVG